MMEWTIIASDILMGGIRVAACLFLIYAMLGSEKPDKKSFFLGFAGGAIIAFALSLFQFPDLYQMALEAVVIAVCASRFQRADTRMSLFVGIFYEIGISFWSFLLAAGLGIIFRSEAFLDGDSISGLSASWAIHLLVIAMVCLASKRQRTREKIPCVWRLWWRCLDLWRW